MCCRGGGWGGERFRVCGVGQTGVKEATDQVEGRGRYVVSLPRGYLIVD